MFHTTVNSPYSVEETVEKLGEAFQKQEFGVLWDFDAKGKLDEKGVGLDNKFRILEVCSPKIAKEVLEETMLAGYFLPCKVVVYEENGETKAGMPNPTKLMEFVDNEKVMKVAEKVEAKMEAAMNEAVK